MICFSILYLISSRLFAQRNEFFHAIGATYMYAFFDEGVQGTIALTYSPRLNIHEFSRYTTLSVGTHASLGFNLSASSTGLENMASLAYELPLTFDVNFGYGAVKRTRSSFGGFFGAGYAVNSLRNSSYNELLGYSESSGLTHGIYVNGGIRFEVERDKSGGVSLYSIIGVNQGLVAGLRLHLDL